MQCLGYCSELFSVVRLLTRTAASQRSFLRRHDGLAGVRGLRDRAPEAPDRDRVRPERFRRGRRRARHGPLSTDGGGRSVLEAPLAAALGTSTDLPFLRACSIKLWIFGQLSWKSVNFYQKSMMFMTIARKSINFDGPRHFLPFSGRARPAKSGEYSALGHGERSRLDVLFKQAGTRKQLYLPLCKFGGAS